MRLNRLPNDIPSRTALRYPATCIFLAQVIIIIDHFRAEGSNVPRRSEVNTKPTSIQARRRAAPSSWRFPMKRWRDVRFTYIIHYIVIAEYRANSFSTKLFFDTAMHQKLETFRNTSDDSTKKIFSNYPSNINVLTKPFSILELVPEVLGFHASLLWCVRKVDDDNRNICERCSALWRSEARISRIRQNLILETRDDTRIMLY